jgi:hypothetical protein
VAASPPGPGATEESKGLVGVTVGFEEGFAEGVAVGVVHGDPVPFLREDVVTKGGLLVQGWGLEAAGFGPVLPGANEGDEGGQGEACERQSAIRCRHQSAGSQDHKEGCQQDQATTETVRILCKYVEHFSSL